MPRPIAPSQVHDVAAPTGLPASPYHSCGSAAGSGGPAHTTIKTQRPAGHPQVAQAGLASRHSSWTDQTSGRTGSLRRAASSARRPLYPAAIAPPGNLQTPRPRSKFRIRGPTRRRTKPREQARIVADTPAAGRADRLSAGTKYKTATLSDQNIVKNDTLPENVRCRNMPKAPDPRRPAYAPSAARRTRPCRAPARCAALPWRDRRRPGASAA